MRDCFRPFLRFCEDELMFSQDKKPSRLDSKVISHTLDIISKQRYFYNYEQKY